MHVLRSGWSSDVLESPNPPVFPAGVRWAISTGVVVLGALMVALVGPGVVMPGEDIERFVLAHAGTALPFLVVGMLCTWEARRHGPAEYLVFWRRWFLASLMGVAGATAAVAFVATGFRALLLVNMVLLVAAVPLWIAATVDMARMQAGRRSVSVDLVDAGTALVVLGAPGVLLVAEPLGSTENLAFALPFALAAVAAPATIYLSTVNLSRIPRGERVAHGIGVALTTASSVNLTMQLARVLGGLELPLRDFVAVHVVNMALVTAVPLWAHRRAVGRLALQPAHRQLRQANPMPYISAVTLPLLGAYVFAIRDEHEWGVWFFVAVVLAVVALNAIRYTAMSRETRRLYAGIAHMAEERQRLLARMLRGLEDDRHRTATELHSQAVGSLATLGTLVQVAHAALPGDSALTVKETIAQLQSDLGARAEHLRQLMLAIRPPVFGDEVVAEVDFDRDDGLAAALLAYASEQWQEGQSPNVDVKVDPTLRLDWATMTIVYRIAQEALLNAAKHARAGSVDVAVTEQRGRILVEVHDDGVGFEPRRVDGSTGSGLATMELFTQLGEGELTLHSKPGEGTLVRSLLRAYPMGAAAAGAGLAGAGGAAGPATTGSPGGPAAGGDEPGVGRLRRAADRHLRLIVAPVDGPE